MNIRSNIFHITLAVTCLMTSCQKPADHKTKSISIEPTAGEDGYTIALVSADNYEQVAPLFQLEQGRGNTPTWYNYTKRSNSRLAESKSQLKVNDDARIIIKPCRSGMDQAFLMTDCLQDDSKSLEQAMEDMEDNRIDSEYFTQAVGEAIRLLTLNTEIASCYQESMTKTNVFETEGQFDKDFFIKARDTFDQAYKNKICQTTQPSDWVKKKACRTAGMTFRKLERIKKNLEKSDVNDILENYMTQYLLGRRVKYYPEKPMTSDTFGKEPSQESNLAFFLKQPRQELVDAIDRANLAQTQKNRTTTFGCDLQQDCFLGAPLNEVLYSHFENTGAGFTVDASGNFKSGDLSQYEWLTDARKKAYSELIKAAVALAIATDYEPIEQVREFELKHNLTPSCQDVANYRFGDKTSRFFYAAKMANYKDQSPLNATMPLKIEAFDTTGKILKEGEQINALIEPLEHSIPYQLQGRFVSGDLERYSEVVMKYSMIYGEKEAIVKMPLEKIVFNKEFSLLDLHAIRAQIGEDYNFEFETIRISIEGTLESDSSKNESLGIYHVLLNDPENNKSAIHMVSSYSAFAILYSDGSVSTWGDETESDISKVAAKLTSGVTKIYSSKDAFAALKKDGSVITWGNFDRYLNGDDASKVSDKLSSGVVDVVPGGGAFAALKEDGSVVTWGQPARGGDLSSLGNKLSSGVVQIVATDWTFAALKEDGSVVTWGWSFVTQQSSSVSSDLVSGVKSITAVSDAIAVLKKDGSVVAWGDPRGDGDYAIDTSAGISRIFGFGTTFAAFSEKTGKVITFGYPESKKSHDIVGYDLITGVESVVTGHHNFSAIRRDGSVVTWGDHYIQDIDGTPTGLESDVTAVYAGPHAFVGVKRDGSAIAWGYREAGNASSVQSMLSGEVKIKNVIGTRCAFAALREDGSVITWGEEEFGGDSSSVKDQISSDVQSVFSSMTAFAAIKKDGSVVTWGEGRFDPQDPRDSQFCKKKK